MEEVLIPIIVVPILFIGLPWLIFHYITKWKQAKTLTVGDEQLLDDLHDMARRLDDRMATIERIMSAENPNWRQTVLPESGQTFLTDASTSLEDEIATPRRRSRRGENA